MVLSECSNARVVGKQLEKDPGRRREVVQAEGRCHWPGPDASTEKGSWPGQVVLGGHGPEPSFTQRQVQSQAVGPRPGQVPESCASPREAS